MIINHNLNAMNAHRNMSINTVNSGKSMEKLSSGLRINRAGDDAAGLAISEKMRGQIRGLDQAARNAQDGISMIQTAEGALSETHSILQRMRELAVQASNDTNTSEDREEIQKEINQLTSEINRIGSNTEFNTQKLLNGNKVGTAQSAVTIAVPGVYEISGITTDNIVIDGVTLTYNGSGDGSVSWKDESTLITLIGNTTLSAIYDVIAGASTSDGTIQLTQKTASLNGPTVSAGLTANATTPPQVVGPARDGAANLQIGANNGQTFTMNISDMRANALGLSGTGAVFADDSDELSDGTLATEYALDIRTAAKATAAVEIIDDAIADVSSERSKLGAYQNRLEHTIANLGTASENLTSAESRVRDVDLAKEMMNFSKNSILSQAAQAMLAQANQQPQGVLQLLR